ncbi:unnamed protein product [Fraxinus pennsylvanica]|uniref:Uncharacterized protein n=1 Tax=Fraxinus pennsylvanica TaxID=56036 RepID=A0AAD1Z281_9LAMI|nr:unnamed protein product [Fraxinus pennsylvanica]
MGIFTTGGLRTRTCFHKGVEDGCIIGKALCTSPSIGSDMGVVTVYDMEDFLGRKRKPLKTFHNLNTELNFMRFNHDSQMLAICSNVEEEQLKIGSCSIIFYVL